MHRFLFFFLFFFIPTLWANELIVEPDNGRAPILRAIYQAEDSIDLITYGFTDEKILAAILEQKKKGKKIRIILEGTPYQLTHENDKTFSQLSRAKISWQNHLAPYRFLHQKTLIIDKKKAIVMTFNFTHSTFNNQRNFGFIVTDPNQALVIEKTFENDWNHRIVKNSIDTLIYSPTESRTAIITLINQAKKNIKIYAQYVDDYQIIGALGKTAKKNVNIEIITSKNLSPKQSKFLQKSGVKIYYNKKYYIHAKVIIIDDKKALIGSTNLSSTSLDKNRELSILIDEPKIVNQLIKIFAHDHQGIKTSHLFNFVNHYLKNNFHEIYRIIKICNKILDDFSQ